MRTLEIRCECGARRTFSGRNVDEVIADIESSGWSETAGTGPKGGGWMAGHCEPCNRAGWSS